MTYALIVTLLAGSTWLGDYPSKSSCTEAALALVKPTAMNVHSDDIGMYASCIPSPVSGNPNVIR